MNFYLNKSYPFKVWVVTLLGGPYSGVLLNLIREPESYATSMLYIPLVISFIGAFISLPAFGLYYLLFHLLGGKLKSEILLKATLCFTSCLLVIAMFKICDMGEMLKPSNKDGFLFFQGVIYTTLASGILFKAYSKKVLPEVKDHLGFEGADNG